MKKKECFKCGEAKPLSSFYKHPQMADGRVNKCKECNKKDVSKNYRANIEHYKKYEQGRAMEPHRVEARDKYIRTDAGREASIRSKRKWIRRNPIKRMASTIVGNAVRDGRLEKPNDCEGCGSTPKRLHGHHDDYAFPLVVRWLCPGCHNKWHKENGSGKNAE
tara:strand:+ start:80 stop:568 length:489 start_codon:yes stop_codon:yes gene_type:complete